MDVAGPRASAGFTSEIKFLVDAALGWRICDWARQCFLPDPHGAGPQGDEYRVTSLYLDTEERDVFHRRGSYGRSKYRIRRYGQEPILYLERKLRTASRLAKRRTAIDLPALPLLDTGETLNGDGTAWFRRRVALRRLRPICQVSYMRVARGRDTPEGPARLTLDHGLAAAATGTLRFDVAVARPLLENQMIVELKYRGTAPAVFKQLVSEFALQPQRASKYRAAAGALGLVQAPAEGDPRTLHA